MRDPLKLIQRRAADLASRRDRLRQRLEEATAAVEAASQRRRELLTADRPADARAIAKADAECGAAENSRRGIEDALAAVESELSEAQAALSQAQEAARRERIAAEIEGHAAALDEAAGALQDAVAALAPAFAALVDAIGRAGTPRSELGLPAAAPEDVARAALRAGLWGVLPVFAPPPQPVFGASAPPLTAPIYMRAEHSEQLRALAAQIRAGELAAVSPTSPERYTPPPRFPAQRVVLQESVSYRGTNGMPVYVSEGDIELPQPVAEVAVARRIGFPPNSMEGREIVAELRQPVMVGTGLRRRPAPSTRSRRGPPYKDLGVDLSLHGAAADA